MSRGRKHSRMLYTCWSTTEYAPALMRRAPTLNYRRQRISSTEHSKRERLVALRLRRCSAHRAFLLPWMPARFWTCRETLPFPLSIWTHTRLCLHSRLQWQQSEHANMFWIALIFPGSIFNPPSAGEELARSLLAALREEQVGCCLIRRISLLACP